MSARQRCPGASAGATLEPKQSRRRLEAVRPKAAAGKNADATILIIVKRKRWQSTAAYVGLLAAAFVVAWLGSYRFFRAQLDNSAYDAMFRLYQPKPWRTQLAILAIDEGTLAKFGGMHIRKPLADALGLLAAVHPSAVAIDVTLTDTGDSAADDRALEQAFCETPRLSCPPC